MSESDRFQLADVMNDHVPDKPIPVYLAATRFPPPLGIPDGQPLASQKRFSGKVANAIWKGHPLLIVAAGQDPPHDPHELNATTAFSPQYFGDLQNVVVVTACETCRRDDTKIMKSANFGQGFVHVAAPGGGDVPGWVSPNEVGLGHGTSQSAAYVAGVAATMIGNFPDAYSSAPLVKLRLQATSSSTAG